MFEPYPLGVAEVSPSPRSLAAGAAFLLAIAAMTHAICVLAFGESFLQTGGGIWRGAVSFRAGEIERADVPRSGACIANLFERGRPRGQEMRQRQQRPHADPQTSSFGSALPAEDSTAKSVIDLGIDRERPSGRRTIA